MICHGPTSLKVHSEYIDQLLVDNGKKDITHFSVRHKLEAWKPYYIHAVFNDNSNYNIKFIDTDYGVAFQNLKRPSCSKCRFKVYDSWYGMPADITIGDYHWRDRVCLITIIGEVLKLVLIVRRETSLLNL